MTNGILEDLSHPPIQATLQDLSTRRLQQTLCSAGCNNHVSALVPEKQILSDVYYSFCLDKVCNANGLPGSIRHSPMCGLCRNCMYRHCTNCNKCSYGSHFNVMPCMNCHDLVLLHDGIAFVPKGSTCPVGQSLIMFSCTCSNGTALWNDSQPKTRKPLVKTYRPHQPPPAEPGLSNLTEEDLVMMAEMQWARAQTDPVARLELIDQIRKIYKSDGSPALTNEMLEQHRNKFAAGAADVKIAGLVFNDGFHDAAMGAMNLIRKKFEAERQQSSKANDEESFQEWLMAQREVAVAAVESELVAARASREPVDKERYKAVLAKTCDNCGLRETDTKALLTCTACKVANYCDSTCQKKARPEHKAECKHTRQAAVAKKNG